jgi:hypothetical protein
MSHGLQFNPAQKKKKKIHVKNKYFIFTSGDLISSKPREKFPKAT